MFRKGSLICFTGIDGAGKTTLARHLASTLSDSGRDYSYVYARFLPMLVQPFWVIGKKLFLRSNGNSTNYVEYSRNKQAVMRNRALSKAHEALLLFDYALQLLFKVQLPLALGKNLVCDRYIYDTVISDLATDLGYPREKVFRTIAFCQRFMPEPDLIFLIDVDEKTTMSRKNDVLDIQYLRERRSIYQDLIGRDGIVVVDGGKTLENNKAFVCSYAKDFLKV